MRALWNPTSGLRRGGPGDDGPGRLLPPLRQRKIYSDKPILYFWAMLAPASWRGALGGGLRLPSVIGGVLTVLLIYRLGRQVFGIRAGFIGAACSPPR